MKYCNFAYEYLYLDTYEGNVALCPWIKLSHASIGNILEEDIDTMWNSEKAQFLRDKHTENCFAYCRPEGCPFIQNNDLPEIEDENKYKELTKNRPYPKIINLAYDFVCNQYCETCRDKVFIPPKDYAKKCNKIREKITPYINKAKMLSASGHGDPFASPYMMNLLSGLQPKDPEFKIMLETNGVFFDEEHWSKIEHLKDCNIEVIITINSFDKFIYEHISRGGNYEKLMHNLDFVKSLREKNYINTLRLTLVIQDRNFREIPSFIKTCLEKYNADGVLLRPVYQWGTMPEEVFWFKDVLNPMHPYHKEYLEILEHPILKDKRVYNFGGDMMHPCREYPVKNNACKCTAKTKTPSTTKKALAHIASSFIPVKSARKKIRDKILNS